MRKVFSILFSFFFLVLCLPGMVEHGLFDYKYKEALFEEIKDINVPSSCIVRKRNEGNEYCSVEYLEAAEIKIGIADIEKQLLQKGFIKTDNERVLRKMLDEKQKQKLGKNYFESFRYINADRVCLSIRLE